MNKFLQHIKERRRGFFAKEEFKKNPEAFNEIANVFSRRFKNKFNQMRDNVDGDSFTSAKDKIAEMAAELSKMYELIDTAYNEERKKPVIEVTDEMEEKLYDIWGSNDLSVKDEAEAIRLAKEQFPGVNGLVICGVFSNYCNDNDPDFDEDED
jgi:hypothetical protein